MEIRTGRIETIGTIGMDTIGAADITIATNTGEDRIETIDAAAAESIGNTNATNTENTEIATTIETTIGIESNCVINLYAYCLALFLFY